MAIHDWTRVDAGTFRTFHTSWITHLMEALNGGLLPAGYYALSEHVATRMQTDVLTLRAPCSPRGRIRALAASPSPRRHRRPRSWPVPIPTASPATRSAAAATW